MLGGILDTYLASWVEMIFEHSQHCVSPKHGSESNDDREERVLRDVGHLC